MKQIKRISPITIKIDCCSSIYKEEINIHIQQASLAVDFIVQITSTCVSYISHNQVTTLFPLLFQLPFWARMSQLLRMYILVHNLDIVIPWFVSNKGLFMFFMKLWVGGGCSLSWYMYCIVFVITPQIKAAYP